MDNRLPQPTRDPGAAKADLDRHGYCLLAEALEPNQLAALRTRLEEQALAEREAGVGYFDGASDQNWGAFRNADGSLREDAFGAANGINQRVWMLVNKGQVFLDLLSHAMARELVGHLMGEHYLLASYTANIANPGRRRHEAAHRSMVDAGTDPARTQASADRLDPPRPLRRGFPRALHGHAHGVLQHHVDAGRFF